MNDHMKKVKSGDALVIPAQTFNTFIDAARDFRARQQGRAQTAQQSFRSSSIILVKNASGYDQDRFAVLGIDSPVITPTDNEDEFKNRLALRGVTPAEAEHVGRFVILAEPLADGEIGWAFAHGICPVKVNMEDEAHTYANIEDAQTQYLKSGTSGAAQILWAESGTGEVWAIVRLGSPTKSTTMFAVKVWRDGGTTNGDATHQCNRTYKVRTLDATGPDTGGVEIGTGMTPKKTRPTTGPLVVPSTVGSGVVGLGYYGTSGDFQLFEANETLDTDAC